MVVYSAPYLASAHQQVFESWPGRVATKSIVRVILEYYRKIEKNLTEQSH